MLLVKCMRIFLLFAAISYCSESRAQQNSRLNDNWQFLKQDIGGIWEAVRPVTRNGPESVPIWSDVTLPHCVNADDATDPDVSYYQGPAWYRTSLNIRNPYKNGRTLLKFEGAGQKCDVYVYTTKVGSHIGGYDEWTVDITDAVNDFKNTAAFKKQFNEQVPVVVRTDNSRDLEMIPSSLSDFNIYGGIYRYLNLVYVPPLSIDKLFVSTQVDKNGKTGTLRIRARLYNSSDAPSAILMVKVKDPGGKEIVRQRVPANSLSGDIAGGEFIFRSLQLWSPGSPKLYTVEMAVINGKDTCVKMEKVGFRDAQFVKNGPFLLNGKRLLLKGTHRHEDHSGVAAAMTEDMQRAEMLLMKEMGVNFIRLGHYQQSHYILDLCDSLGILVWEEIPWCRGGLGGNIYKEQARRMLTNMIEQHYDHPSVIIWGLGNENDWPGDFPTFDTAQIKSFMIELNDLSHQLDRSRKTAIRRCDFCKDIPDIYSPSIWAGWYRGNFMDYKNFTKKEFGNVNTFLHVEWGGDSHAKQHAEKPDDDLLLWLKSNDTATFIKNIGNAKDGDWNESYICNLIDWHLKEQETMPWLSGTAAWTFKDFSTAIRPDNPVPYMNQKGVVERDLTKKEAYYVFQSWWSDKPMAHIYGHNAPIRWGNTREEKLVKVYSNCDKAELFINGKSAGIKKRDGRNFPAAGLYWNIVFEKGNNTVVVKAFKNKDTIKDSVTFYYETEKWGKPAKAVLEKYTQQNGIAMVKVKLLDGQGRQCLDATNWVRFGLAGDGRLIDNLGTSTGSHLIRLYNGTAQISLKTNNGRSVVSAKVDDVETIFINVNK